jgi:hypothetical protein
MQLKYCYQCEKDLSVSEFGVDKSRLDGKRNRCRICNNRTAGLKKKTLKTRVFKLLGNKCTNPNCRHLNEDGTLGCTDQRLLQVDHPNGGGTEEFFKLGTYGVYRKILRVGGVGYRLLCAQCNWLHRFEDF